MTVNLKPSGIEGLGEISWGTHFCLFYETKQDLLDFFIPFFEAGLENDAFCLCVASEPLIAEEAEQAMRQAFPNFERYVAEGQIEITPHTDWYLKEGHFDEQRVLQGWIDKLNQALAKGFSGLRFAANILLEKSEWKSFAQYEGKLDGTLRDLQIEGVCAYNMNRYSAANVLDIVRYHQFTIARRGGVWESLEGPELRHAHEEIQKLNADLERRVIERTSQLAAANEQLRTEVDKRQRVEESLREYEKVVEGLEEMIVVVDREYRYVIANQAFLNFRGMDREHVVGHLVSEILDTGVFEKVVKVKLDECFQGKVVKYELKYTYPELGERDLFLSYFPIEGPNGIHRAACIINDITERKQAEEALRKSERVLREAESLGHTGSWEQDLVTGEIFNTDENLRLFFGDDHSKGADFEDYAEVVHPDDREYVMQRRTQLLAEVGPRDIEYRVVWPDGSVHVIFGRATVVYNELGQALRVYGTNVDITERKQSEEEIRLYATRMEALAEISRTFVEAGLDYQSVLNTVARRTAELIGDSCVITLFSDDGQQSFPVAFYHSDSKALALMRDGLLKTWQGGTDTYRYRTLLSGESIYIPVVNPEEFRASLEPEFWPYQKNIGISSVLIVPLQTQGRVIGTLGITRDGQGPSYTPEDQLLLQDLADRAALTIQNARLFEQVQAANERLQVLSRRLVEVQESERTRLAREIHDDVSQSLTALMMHLGTAKGLLPKSAKPAQAILEQTEELIGKTLERTRLIIADLRPQVLDDLGLIPAIRRLGDELHDNTGAAVKIKTSHLPKRLPKSIEVGLFRIVQEALANVRKHAQARHVNISLAKESGRVVLTVQDDGIGFEKQAARSSVDGEMIIDGGVVIASGHFGLIGVQERVTQLGGNLEVTSAPGQGTTLRVELPLESEGGKA